MVISQKMQISRISTERKGQNKQKAAEPHMGIWEIKTKDLRLCYQGSRRKGWGGKSTPRNHD